MKKWIVLGVIGILLVWFFWSACVVAGRADDRMEEMMKRGSGNECKEFSEAAEETGQTY